MALNENAKKWIAALRSSEYDQGRCYLQQGSRYCCLGVATDIYIKETGDSRQMSNGVIQGCVLPQYVADFFGLRTVDGAFHDVIERGCTTLWHLNDRVEWDFNKIADYIESEPAGLFVS